MSEPGPQDRNLVTLALVAGFGFAALGLIGLVAMVYPAAVFVVMTVAGFYFLGAFHYVVWGWWLGPLLHQREAERLRESNPGSSN